MKRKFGFVLVGLVFAAVAAPVGVQARTEYLDVFNNRYQTNPTNIGVCSVCHTAIPALNKYGNAFRRARQGGLTAGKALKSIQPRDSDRDTFNNISEIRARTFPGNKNSHP